MFIRIANCFLNSSRELISTIRDGKEFQSFVAVGMKEYRWQLIRKEESVIYVNDLLQHFGLGSSQEFVLYPLVRWLISSVSLYEF